MKTREIRGSGLGKDSLFQPNAFQRDMAARLEAEARRVAAGRPERRTGNQQPAAEHLGRLLDPGRDVDRLAERGELDPLPLAHHADEDRPVMHADADTEIRVREPQGLQPG